jgi:hypothetical protein
MAKKKEPKWYELDFKKHGIGGLTTTKPKRRKEDRRAKSWEGYAVVFFPQVELSFKAQVGFMGTVETLSQTAEAARVKYADKIGGPDSPDKKWTEYQVAGHRVRRVKIIDMGPA